MGKVKKFFTNFVFSFGFLEGLWVAIGIDPKAKLIEFLQPMFDFLGDKWIFVLFTLLPLLLFLLTIYLIHRKGRKLGIVSVLIAFVAGTLIISSTKSALILLVVAAILGWYATKKKF